MTIPAPFISRAASMCAVALALACGVAACTVTSQSLMGPPRAPVLPEDVRLYTEALTARHDDIATLQTSSRGSWTFTGDGKFEVVIDRLKQAAAKLGANGLVIEDLTPGGGSADARVSPDLTRDHAEIGVGLSLSGLFSSRTARATAVYVYP